MKETAAEFPCDRCGLCCRNLKNISLYDDLDRGDGVCKFLDELSNLCTIYINRPMKCNVVAAYELFSNRIGYEEYIALNIEYCRRLKEKEKCQYHL